MAEDAEVIEARAGVAVLAGSEVDETPDLAVRVRCDGRNQRGEARAARHPVRLVFETDQSRGVFL